MHITTLAAARAAGRGCWRTTAEFGQLGGRSGAEACAAVLAAFTETYNSTTGNTSHNSPAAID